MGIINKISKRFPTKDKDGTVNGYLVPIYNIHDKFYPKGKEPQQVYLTVISPGFIKGPHLHYIRTGCFTCIKGNARFVVKTESGYQVFYSGDEYEYRSVIIPTGTPAALQNIGNEDAFVLNMPTPAWTPTMADEYSADFDDFDFSLPVASKA
jgi:dTDP-4-dehydrorhamnose 3,5-epimerase-like enzyme